MFDLITKLSDSVSEITLDEAFTNAIADQLSEPVDMDREGNLFINRKEHAPVLLIAPFFTYPLSVERVYEDGAVGLELYDSPSLYPLPGSDILIHGRKVYKGVVGSVPPHLQKGYSSSSPYQLSDLKCDVGREYDELSKNVFPGTRITYAGRPYRLLEGKIAGRNLDLISPAAALLECADKLDKDVFTICFCTNCSAALEEIKPETVIVIDVIDIEQRRRDYLHGEGLGKLYVETGPTVTPRIGKILKAAAASAGVGSDWLARSDRTEDPKPITWEVQIALGGLPVGVIYLPYEGGSSGMQMMAENAAEQLGELLQQLKPIPERSI